MDFPHAEQEHFETDISEKQNEEAQLKSDAAPLNSIDRIKVAEQKADELLSSAQKEAASIISDAKIAAKSLIDDSEKAAKDSVANSIIETQQANRVLMDELNAVLDIEMQALKDAAVSRMAETVELIHKSMV